MNPRAILLDCFRAALAAVDGRLAVQRELALRPLRGEWHLIAIGKAAGAMAQGVVDAMAARVLGGLVIVPAGHLPAGFDPATHGLDVRYAAHPVPDESSLAAGDAVIEFVARLRADAQLLCLVSGGASSLVEALVPGKTLGDLQALNRWAMESGASIAEINAARRTISRLKGGGLARLAAGHHLRALMISDVPGDDPRIIGSGLLHASTQPAAEPTPEVPVRIVASIGLACRAAAENARAQGLKARVVSARLEGEAVDLGTRIATTLASQSAGQVWVRGGESTVRLPAEPGRGGRNQHLALAAAIELARSQVQGGVLLAAGTDGVDGASEDAGAIVDATTCLRGRDAGCDPHASLERADSGTFLEAAGDLLHTGPTLTNVGDLVLALRS